MKYGLLILAGLMMVACSSTKITNYIYRPRLLEGKKIFFMPIDGTNEIGSIGLFYKAKSILEYPSDKIFFLLNVEYDLIGQKGISKEILYDPKHFDSLQFLLKKHLDIHYVVQVRIDAHRKGNVYRSYTARQVNKYNRHYYQGNETSEAVLIFTIYNTDQYILEGEFTVNTSVSPLTILEDDGGETRINFAAGSAMSKAFGKGIKYIKKGLVKVAEQKR